jgi:hypothetical protein
MRPDSREHAMSWVIIRALGAALVMLLGPLLAAGPAAAQRVAQPAEGVYIIRPLEHPRDCLRTRSGGGSRIFLAIETGCRSGGVTELFLLLRAPHGGTTVRPYASPRSCATVARAVIFGAPAIDVLACDHPDGRCEEIARDQIWAFRGPDAWRIEGMVDLGAEPSAVWDVGDYGDTREVKYWYADGPSAPKQRFILEPVRARRPAGVECAETLPQVRTTPSYDHDVVAIPDK